MQDDRSGLQSLAEMLIGSAETLQHLALTIGVDVQISLVLSEGLELQSLKSLALASPRKDNADIIPFLTRHPALEQLHLELDCNFLSEVRCGCLPALSCFYLRWEGGKEAWVIQELIRIQPLRLACIGGLSNWQDDNSGRANLLSDLSKQVPLRTILWNGTKTTYNTRRNKQSCSSVLGSLAPHLTMRMASDNKVSQVRKSNR